MSFGIIVDAKKRKMALRAKGLADCSIREAMQVKPDFNVQKAQNRQLAEKIAKSMGRHECLAVLPTFVNKFCKKGEK